MNLTLLSLFVVFQFCVGDMTKKEKEMFGSKSLKCLVCKALVEEFQAEIDSIDPKKKIESGSFRLAPNGEMKTKLVSYVRSEQQLNEMVDSVCKEFEDYAQAKEKSNGEATIVRIMDRNGGMSARFSEVDIVPDDDLNTRLKFYCESIVEEYESDIFDLFGKPRKEITKELCLTRSHLCSSDHISRDEL